MHHVDLLATFYEIGSGATPSAAGGLDSVPHWAAIMGDASCPRDELVLNLPRSPNWQLGQDATSEGVALRASKCKFLINHGYDGWWAPVDGHQSQMLFVPSRCDYSWYATGSDSRCDFSNYLFDLEADPHEMVNFWDMSDYADIQANLILRAEELVAAQGNYGKILYEWYMRPSIHFKTEWEANNWYVSPWGCEVVP